MADWTFSDDTTDSGLSEILTVAEAQKVADRLLAKSRAATASYEIDPQ